MSDAQHWMEIEDTIHGVLRTVAVQQGDSVVFPMGSKVGTIHTTAALLLSCILGSTDSLS